MPPGSTAMAPLPVVIGAYCLCSVSMLIANKLAVSSLHSPLTLVWLQNSATVVALLALDGSGLTRLHPLQSASAAQWVLPSALHLSQLVTSAVALRMVTVPTVIVFRNLNSLIVALGERLLLGQRIRSQTVVALCVILAGFTLYANTDISYHPTGYMWLAANLFFTCAYALVAKGTSQRLGHSPLTYSYFNNAISVVLLAPPILWSEDPAATAEYLLAPDNSRALLQVLVTMVIGVGISLAGFFLQSRVTATTFQVINNINKVPLILLSFVLFDQNLSAVSIAGLALSSCGGMMYSWSRLAGGPAGDKPKKS